MKKFLTIHVSLALLLLLNGCAKNFNILPETQVAESPDLFKTEAGLKVFSDGFYNNLDFNSIKDDKFSDNMEHIANPPAIRTGIYAVPTALGSGGWNWAELTNLNYFIENVEKYTPDPALKNKYLGLAKFFRAWFYFKKVKTFGDVPWYSKPLGTNDEQLYKKRDPRVLVIDSVLKDIDFAIRYLPETKSKNRISKWTALALKSRITLFEGSWRKYHKSDKLPGAEDLLNECVKASKELIDSKMYTLFTEGDVERDYARMFQATDAKTQEVILARSSSVVYFYYTPEFTSTSNGNNGATFSLVSDYPMRSGIAYYTYYAGNIDTKEYFDEFTDRDYRLKQSILSPGYIRLGTTTKSVNDFAENRTGYQVIKRVGPPIEDQGGDNRDAILIRFAEILLNYAEARAILSRLNQQDLDITINALRRRAGITNDLKFPLVTDAAQLNRYRRTTDQNVLEISRERRIELAFEGFRRDDLIRWNEGHLFRTPYDGIYINGFGQLIDLDRDGAHDLMVLKAADAVPKDKIPGVQYFKLSAVNGLSNATGGRIRPYNKILPEFQDWEYLNPIPKEELTLNKNLEQNPGWEQVK